MFKLPDLCSKPSPYQLTIGNIAPERLLVVVADYHRLGLDADLPAVDPAELGLSSQALPKRIRERLASILLLESIHGFEKLRIGRRDDGSPYIVDIPELHISIAHSATHCALALSTHPVGIDIENNSPKLQRVASKFLTDSEMQWLVTPVQLLQAWTIKEAVYKLFHPLHLPLHNIEITVATPAEATVEITPPGTRSSHSLTAYSPVTYTHQTLPTNT
ncbi:MAG: 4'-phosphopantetheinyl transferase superfamily protein, partial [Muribaculaceae bacterium]|nr:4'-phosphopantetheinyl transferase superfamily protein [Muribaculaceae bacterium]